MRPSTLALVVVLAVVPSLQASVPDQAVELRNLGNAQLENEQPALALSLIHI